MRDPPCAPTWRSSRRSPASAGRRSWSAGRTSPGPVSAFYRVLIAGAVLIPWRLDARRRPRPLFRARRGLDRGRGRRVLRARSGAVEHGRDEDAGGGRVDPRQQHADLRRDHVVARAAPAAARVVLDRPRARAGGLRADHERGPARGRTRSAAACPAMSLALGGQRVLRRLPDRRPSASAARWTR